MVQKHRQSVPPRATTDPSSLSVTANAGASNIGWPPARTGRGTAPEQIGTEFPEAMHSEAPLIDRSFAFVDLCGFTAFMDEHGVHEAQRELRTLREQIREVTSRRGVSVAKWLGDGAMLVSSNVGPTMAAATELAARYHGEPMALRGGVAHGPALVFDGDDYVGQPANLAARLCSAARAGEVLAVGHPAASLPPWVRVVRTRDITLRGLGRYRHIQSIAAISELEDLRPLDRSDRTVP